MTVRCGQNYRFNIDLIDHTATFLWHKDPPLSYTNRCLAASWVTQLYTNHMHYWKKITSITY
jgi:hypothetical protein